MLQSTSNEIKVFCLQHNFLAMLQTSKRLVGLAWLCMCVCVCTIFCSCSRFSLGLGWICADSISALRFSHIFAIRLCMVHCTANTYKTLTRLRVPVVCVCINPVVDTYLVGVLVVVVAVVVSVFLLHWAPVPDSVHHLRNERNIFVMSKRHNALDALVMFCANVCAIKCDKYYCFILLFFVLQHERRTRT